MLRRLIRTSSLSLFHTFMLHEAWIASLPVQCENPNLEFINQTIGYKLPVNFALGADHPFLVVPVGRPPAGDMARRLPGCLAILSLSSVLHGAARKMVGWAAHACDNKIGPGRVSAGWPPLCHRCSRGYVGASGVTVPSATDYRSRAPQRARYLMPLANGSCGRRGGAVTRHCQRFTKVPRHIPR
jgi:hypothetical protein